MILMSRSKAKRTYWKAFHNQAKCIDDVLDSARMLFLNESIPQYPWWTISLQEKKRVEKRKKKSGVKRIMQTAFMDRRSDPSVDMQFLWFDLSPHSASIFSYAERIMISLYLFIGCCVSCSHSHGQILPCIFCCNCPIGESNTNNHHLFVLLTHTHDLHFSYVTAHMYTCYLNPRNDLFMLIKRKVSLVCAHVGK